MICADLAGALACTY